MSVTDVIAAYHAGLISEDEARNTLAQYFDFALTEEQAEPPKA